MGSVTTDSKDSRSCGTQFARTAFGKSKGLTESGNLSKICSSDRLPKQMSSLLIRKTILRATKHCQVISLTEDDEPESKQAKLESASLHEDCFCQFTDSVKPLLLPEAVLANWAPHGLLSFESVVIDPLLAFDLSGSHQLVEEA
ncbi:hypothetical protein WA026_020630 [Henosepilachna vigintioctopunctata]|uniref:Uncharacterized protein n=1 Tax=Henosepilachna vigintioctopunctata TaxID=420089 RepID=A0AAW1V4X6_9CUCU